MRKVFFPRLKKVWIKSRKRMHYRTFETKIWMKKKVFPKSIINKTHWNKFPVIGVLVTPRALQATNFAIYVHILETSILKIIANSFLLTFTLLDFHRNSLCMRCIAVAISLGIGKTWAKDTNFDKANVLKIIILPPRVRFIRRHILKIFSIAIIPFLKFWSSSIFLLYQEKSLVFLLHL